VRANAIVAATPLSAMPQGRPPGDPAGEICDLAQATGLLPDYDKCQAYIADVRSAFRSGS
jgi:hypothetical protein